MPPPPHPADLPERTQPKAAIAAHFLKQDASFASSNLPETPFLGLPRTFFLPPAGAERRVVSVMKRLLPATLLALSLASCYGTKDFTIRTEPEGATIAINGRPYEGRTTPMTVTIEQDKNLGITAMKPGYEVATRTVETKTSLWGAILWNKHDSRAQYIEEDEVTIPLQKIPTAANFTPSSIPGYQPPGSIPGYQPPASRGLGGSSAPALRSMPNF